MHIYITLYNVKVRIIAFHEKGRKIALTSYKVYSNYTDLLYSFRL